MRLYFSRCRFFIPAFCFIASFFVSAVAFAACHDIRVLLGELRSGAWQLVAPGGFHLTRSGSGTTIRVPNKELLVVVRRGQVRVNGRLMRHDNVILRAHRGPITFADKSYNGDMRVITRSGTAYLVNVLGLEDYVSSVLRAESWPGWPLEVNKVFSIASRSYALAMRQRAEKNKRPYHLKNTNKHQTYAGVHDCEVIKKAVAMTRGLYLSYEDKPILAMFDSCCGGVVPAKIADFDFKRAPYLAREKACTYCKRCKIYSWQASWPLDSFERLFRPRIAGIGSLKDVSVAQKDAAGLSTKVTLKGRNGQHNFSGQKIYSTIKEVKSFCFDVKTKAGKVTLSGRGFGHHIGLCQWGAREMVRDGWPYKRILQFYYPGTQLKRLA